MRWMQRLKRVFRIDIQLCRRCGFRKPPKAGYVASGSQQQ